jgi:hypothetical protein
MRLKLLLLSVLFLVLGIRLYQAYRPTTEWTYKGELLRFRADLREASKVPAYPSEEDIRNALWDPALENLTIVFMDTPDIELTAVQAFEIAYKLTLAYLKSGRDVRILPKQVDSFELRNGTFVALLPPSIANRTAVSLRDKMITIEGITARDFDLATVKLLIIALDIS